jgi:hypothetical protein
MKVPSSYSEWLECFDIVKDGTNDAEVLECMKHGCLSLSAGVAGRFASQLTSLLQFRIKKASSKFSRSMQNARGELNCVTNALISVRKEYKYLLQIAKLPVIPLNDSQILVSALRQQADSMQDSLESTSVKNDRSGVLTSIIRRNRINDLEITEYEL